MTKQEVDAWFKDYDNPLKAEVQRVREILLAADERIEETIKWQAPTFMYKGNLASFFPRSKEHVSLMFHTGAQISGDFPHLEGSGETARVSLLNAPKTVSSFPAEYITIWLYISGK